MKYICPVEYYPNCRVHEGGFYDSVKFFENKKQLLDYALKFIVEYVILDIFNIKGKSVGKVEYELGTHNCTGIRLRIKKENYRTIDNGKGNLIWEKY